MCYWVIKHSFSIHGQFGVSSGVVVNSVVLSVSVTIITS